MEGGTSGNSGHRGYYVCCSGQFSRTLAARGNMRGRRARPQTPLAYTSTLGLAIESPRMLSPHASGAHTYGGFRPVLYAELSSP